MQKKLKIQIFFAFLLLTCFILCENRDVGKKEAAHPGRVCGVNAVGSLFYFFGKFGALFEFNGFAGSDFDSFFGAGVDACAGGFFSNRECSETNESNFFAGGKSSRDGFNSGFESGFGISFGQAGFFGDCIDKVRFVHGD